jgi:hypothetical protein
VEAAGSHWVAQEVREMRAVSNARIIRQDWDHISRGLANHAIDQGWWPADGCKLDFAGVLKEDRHAPAVAFRRWGRTTLLLQEQNGHIDLGFLRRLLSEHEEEGEQSPPVRNTDEVCLSICRHTMGPGTPQTVSSFLTSFHHDGSLPVMAWFAFGLPCQSVYFPVFLDGELPPGLTEEGAGTKCSVSRFVGRLGLQEAHVGAAAREAFSRLQSRFDQETEEFCRDAAEMKRAGQVTELQRQASLFMEHNLEQFIETCEELPRIRPLAALIH